MFIKSPRVVTGQLIYKYELDIVVKILKPCCIMWDLAAWSARLCCSFSHSTDQKFSLRNVSHPKQIALVCVYSVLSSVTRGTHCHGAGLFLSISNNLTWMASPVTTVPTIVISIVCHQVATFIRKLDECHCIITL